MAKKKSKETRLQRSYRVYSRWYDKYSKTSEMDSPKMSKEDFSKTMAEYRELDIANPARSAAASQRVLTRAQVRGFSQLGAAFTDAQINTLKQASFPVPKKFTQKWIKKNASIYYSMVQYLGIKLSEVVSPKEAEVI